MIALENNFINKHLTEYQIFTQSLLNNRESGNKKILEDGTQNIDFFSQIYLDFKRRSLVFSFENVPATFNEDLRQALLAEAAKEGATARSLAEFSVEALAKFLKRVDLLI